MILNGGLSGEKSPPAREASDNYQKLTNNDTHGFDGPIAIRNGGQIIFVAQDFLRACLAIGVWCTLQRYVMVIRVTPRSDLIHKLDDIHDLKTAHGAETWAKYINCHTGRRNDAFPDKVTLLR